MCCERKRQKKVHISFALTSWNGCKQKGDGAFSQVLKKKSNKIIRTHNGWGWEKSTSYDYVNVVLYNCLEIRGSEKGFVSICCNYVRFTTNDAAFGDTDSLDVVGEEDEDDACPFLALL